MQIMLGIVVAAVVLGGCGQVDPGERATFTRWGTMDQKCYGQGLYWYNPIGTNMDLVDIQVQAFEAKNMGAATRDLQEVHATVVVNYALDGDSCHKLLTEVGHDYREKVLAPALQDALKAGTAHFALDQIIKERAKLREEVTKALQVRVSQFYIRVADNGVNLTNFEISKAFSAAVEAKQIEEQRAQQKAFLVIQATRDAEARREKAKGEADAVREAAKGDAEALRTKGQAQAEYNAKVSASLTSILLQSEAIAAWKTGGSQVPKITGAQGMLLQIPIPQPQTPMGK